MEIGLNNNYNTTTNTNDLTKKDDSGELSKKEEESEQEKKGVKELNEGEKQMVLELQARDAEVKAHEAAHQSGGAATGGATFTYQQGPDGKMYAIGGEVSISLQNGSTPQETISNARAVIASALAPANPSGQDMAVASSAMVMMMKAQQQLSKETQEKLLGEDIYGSKAKNSNRDEENKSHSDEIDIPA